MVIIKCNNLRQSIDKISPSLLLKVNNEDYSLYYCSTIGITMSLDRLLQHRAAWMRKAVLRHIYLDYFERIRAELEPGKTLELGSGPGIFKEFLAATLSSDVIWSPWLDTVLDATAMPFKKETFANLVLIDVVHHLAQPGLFFQEAIRVLQNRGKIVILDVQITPFSYPVYHFFHQEPVRMKINPLEPSLEQDPDDPFDSNQAITTLLFGSYWTEFQRSFPQLKLRQKKYFSFLNYPLSGGFEHRSFLTMKMYQRLLKVEKLLQPLARLLAFRNLIVLQKQE
ncbi:class I SAM-dependent methyltransferase [candidate division CSSED10-310 bacterium]|uniref:Class I SAM-dependent methyltransferase n=1 Tax=candidate division CSSED10-310 bacterium TaxID=2855610 RepID=A0ABV6Z6F6_UNCC1